MRRNWSQLVRAGLVVPAVLAAVSAVTLPASAAGPGCSSTDSAFCWTVSLELHQPHSTTGAPPAGAADPADLVVSLQNSSTDLNKTTTHWIHDVTLALPSATMLVPSASVPNGTAVAPGSTTCAAAKPNFTVTACPAGFGHFWASTPAGFEPGTFGVESITNVNPPANGGSTLDYNATIAYCLSTPLGSCTPNGTTTLSFTTSASSPGTITVPLSTSIDVVGLGGPTSVPVAIDRAYLHLWGTSGSYTILRMPAKCGLATVKLTATDSNTTTAATTPPASFAFPVSGCPFAGFADTESAAYTTHLDGSASKATLSGRTVNRWIWTFGDGSGTTTSTPTVNHTYAHTGNYTVTLVAEDNLGALSPLVARRLYGTTLTETPATSTITDGQSVTLRGRLTHYGTSTGIGGVHVTLYRCTPGTMTCAYVTTLTTSATSTTLGDYSYVAKPVHNAVFKVMYAGHSPNLGSTAAAVVDVRSAVSIKLSSATTSVDQFVTVSGAVGPNQAGRNVELERYVNGAWTVLAKPTLSTGSQYAYDVVPTSKGTYTYRVVDPADPQNLEGVSRSVTLTVR